MSVGATPTAPVSSPAGPRWRRPSLPAFLVLVLAVGLIAHGFTDGAAVSPLSLVDGLSRTGEFVAEAFPPDLGRLGPVVEAMLVTLEMALIGTIAGVAVSLPLAVLAARNTTPHPVVHGVTRGAIAFLRSVPDLVWGIIFVVTVGLGPEAGAGDRRRRGAAGASSPTASRTSSPT